MKVNDEIQITKREEYKRIVIRSEQKAERSKGESHA